MPSIKGAVRFGLFALVAIVVAAFVGVQVGEAVKRARLERFRSTSASVSQDILSKMENVNKGDEIHEYIFEDLERNVVEISKLIKNEKTALVFVNPDCFTCLEEIQYIQEVVKDPEKRGHFILISSGNPLHLRDLRDEYDIKLTILYDHMAHFSNRFKVVTYPFNLIVDSDLRVLEAIPRALSQSEIESIAD